MIWMNEVMEFCTVRENIQKKRVVRLGGMMICLLVATM